MNFFERQENARRQSRRLIVLFVLAVLAIVVAVDAAILIGVSLASPSLVAEAGGILGLARERSGIMIAVSLLVLATIGIASLVRIIGLQGGGSEVARQLGGVLLPLSGGDPRQRRLRNVVEEIAIASGVPVPRIFVLEEEPGINAFAAGYSPADAAVAVTRGALDRLDRDELQGVIAHEFSHILNGDMRLNIRLIGLLFGILVIGTIGQRVLVHGSRSRRGRGRDSMPLLVVALLLTLIGYIGVFFGRLIKAGVSRQREYLADASAVQFTRQSVGIAGALKKIGALKEGSRLEAAEGEEVSHMLFGEGFDLSSLMATHPPLLDRIRALEPGFKAEHLEGLRRGWATEPPSGLDEGGVSGLHAEGGELPSPRTSIAVAPSALSDQVGHPEAEDYRRADLLLRSIPSVLHEAAHDRDAAPALLLALLLAEDAATLDGQRAILSGSLPAAEVEAVARLCAPCRGLHPLLRLPLAELAFPALRQRPRARVLELITVANALVHADGRVEMFEYCLATLVATLARDALAPAATRIGHRKLHEARDSAVTLLAVLAAHGHRDEADARRGFQAGLARLYPNSPTPFAPPRDWVSALDAVWPALDRLRPEAKEMLVEALLVCADHDGRIEVVEAELLRTVCALLHCPLPPALRSTV